MIEPVRATLEVIQGDSKGKKITVQFNPQTLRVNHHITGNTGSNVRGKQAEKQGETEKPTGFSESLSMELLFDTSTTQPIEDVRQKTLIIASMLAQKGTKSDGSRSTAPVVRFHWGTFLFTGNIESMDETLELFSDQGVPLRATVNLGMNGVSLERGDVSSSSGSGSTTMGFSGSVGFSAAANIGFSAGASLNAGIAVGTSPLTLAQAGDTLQGLAGRAGIDVSWKALASANNIDNPRMIPAGTVLNLNANIKVNP